MAKLLDYWERAKAAVDVVATGQTQGERKAKQKAGAAEAQLAMQRRSQRARRLAQERKRQKGRPTWGKIAAASGVALAGLGALAFAGGRVGPARSKRSSQKRSRKTRKKMR